MQYTQIFLTFIFGAAIGSFLNVVILRLPQEKKLDGRSHCASCGRQLGALDLVPILSFLFLGGKCRYCKHKISPRYFIIETITAVLFAWAYLIIMPVRAVDFLLLLKFLIVISVCVITFVVDLEHEIILFNVVAPLTVVVLIINLIFDIASGHNILSGSFFSGIAGAVLGCLPIYALYYASKWRTGEKGSWMGFGDVYLMVFLGAATGWPLVGMVLFLGILLGGAVSVLLLLFGNKTLKSRVPFGVFLVPAAIAAMFYGDKILHWYLAILGF